MTHERNQYLARVKAAIGDARREINRNNSPIARGILKTFYANSDDIVGTSEAAELSLTMAESFSAENKLEAGAYFQEFFDRVRSVADQSGELLMRAHENFGHFFFSVVKRPEKARAQYVEAKTLAVCNGFREASARAQLRILCIDFDASRDAQSANLKLLVCVARDEGFTSQQTLVAWALHLEKLSQSSQGRRFFAKRR